MKRLLRLAILCLPLMGFSCEGPEGQALYRTVFGGVAAKNAVLALGEFDAGVEVAVAFVQEPEVMTVEALVETEAVAFVEPEPEVVEPVTVPEPVCEEWLFRGRWYDCHGNWLRDVE